MEEIKLKMKHLKTLDEELSEFEKELGGMKTKKVHKPRKTFICKLAASYGKLDCYELNLMDEGMREAIGVTKEAIENLEDRSWDNVVACMMANPVLERNDDSNQTSSKLFIMEKFNFFKFDGSPDPGVVMQIRSWFTELITDSDILDDTSIDIDHMAKIVAQTGATVTGPLTFVGKHASEERVLFDVGILRYPNRASPFFKLYRIRLTGWSKCTRVLMIQKDSNGISGNFHRMKFSVRKDAVASLRREARDNAIAVAERVTASLSKAIAAAEGAVAGPSRMSLAEVALLA